MVNKNKNISNKFIFSNLTVIGTSYSRLHFLKIEIEKFFLPDPWLIESTLLAILPNRTITFIVDKIDIL